MSIDPSNGKMREAIAFARKERAKLLLDLLAHSLPFGGLEAQSVSIMVVTHLPGMGIGECYLEHAHSPDDGTHENE